jgi:hypothetical protein
MAAQLPPRDQLKLVAQIGERLSEKEAAPGETLEERQERLAKVEALFAEIDALADSIEGEFDSAKDIREIREERANRR